LILGDPTTGGGGDFEGRIEIKIEVDGVESMKGKGQYIYVSVAPSTGGFEKEERPLVMFNNGHEGGSQAELFGYNEDPEGNIVGMFKEKLKPALLELLQR
jgi:hypothetical protein